ncbi:hypothetical protein VWX97_04605 [Phaeobacter sp. JH18-32]|uniref:hypothetical protein n=1 Tax=Phaeobacter TaxID=302485 RepID=UPI003A83B679
MVELKEQLENNLPTDWEMSFFKPMVSRFGGVARAKEKVAKCCFRGEIQPLAKWAVGGPKLLVDPDVRFDLQVQNS